MAAIQFYPYPRLTTEPKWWGLRAFVDGAPVDLDQVEDRWDADSDLSFEVGVEISADAVEGFDQPELVVTAACSETAVSVVQRVSLIRERRTMTATGRVSLSGADVAEGVEIRASLVAPLGDVDWLSRRVIAQRRTERVSLDAERGGFPTTAVSFKANGFPEAPWFVDVNAEALSDTLVHSVTLTLNVDYPRVGDLISGEPDRDVEAELNASIIRVLVATTSRLLDEHTGVQGLAPLIDDAPESIAAAASQACRNYFKRDLEWAVSLYRNRPDEFDMQLLSAVQALRGRS